MCELHACVHMCEAVVPPRPKGARENSEKAPAHNLEYLWQLGRGGSVAWCQGQDNFPESEITEIPTHKTS